MALFIHRAVHLAAALLAEQRVLARGGWVGENDGLFEPPTGSYPMATDVRSIEA